VIDEKNEHPSPILLLLVIMSSAQFIFTLDTTFMNVSITTLVKDLNTTVSGVQGAITFYALVMAAFMIAGAKVGDIIGRKRAFVIGLIVYGIGSLITGLAPNLPVLILGWSVLEGLGAALVMPAMISLVISNFEPGVDRMRAYAVIPAAAAIGAAAGPIIGGFLTSYLSWRLGFLMEVLVVIFILFMRGRIKDAPLESGMRPKFDYAGLVLSVAGLGILVYGIILANTYGFFKCRVPFTIAGKQVLAIGDISPTILFVIVGLVIIGLFVLWEILWHRRGKSTLISPELLKNMAVVCGISTNMFQYFLMAGAIFSLSLFAQIVLGYDAFTAGLTILPLSISVFLVAAAGARLAKRFYPKRIIQVGFIVMLVGTALLGLGMGKNISGADFIPSLLVLGAGLGLVASQLNNIQQSAVEPEQTSETSGLNYTFQNLGTSLGTAIAGALIITILITTSPSLIQQSTVLTPDQQASVEQYMNDRAQKASSESLDSFLQGQPPEVAQEVESISVSAQRKALGAEIILLSILAAFGFLATLGLPKRKIEETAALDNVA
jgi:MFS family permease